MRLIDQSLLLNTRRLFHNRYKRLAMSLLCLAAIFFWTGCETKQEAVGADDEIIVLVDAAGRDDIVKTLRQIFSDTLYTPSPEPEYKLKIVDPAGFHDLKDLNNVIIGSIGNDLANPATNLVSSLLGDKRFAATLTGTEHLIFARDQFAKNQIFMILSAGSREELLSNLLGREVWIKNQFNEKLKKRQRKYLFGKSRRSGDEKLIRDTYHWEVNIPWGWEIIRNNPDERFLWLGRETPYQWLVIHSVPGIVVTDSISAADYFRKFPEGYLGDVRVTEFQLKGELAELNRWNAWRYTGVWESDKEALGGPFLSYLFYDGQTDQTYLLFTLVHFPGHRKNLYMKQLDLIAHSFKILGSE